MKNEPAVKLVERGYNKIYKGYNKHRRGNRKEVGDLSRLLPKGAQVLDVGCGSGHITKFLVEEGFVVTGTDISTNMLKLAIKKVPGVRFYKMDMRKLKFTKIRLMP